MGRYGTVALANQREPCVRTLLVEDDEMIGKSLVRGLERSGWAVDWVRDGLLAQSAMADGDYNCEVLRRARSLRDDTPVLILTARAALGQRIEGLDLGADDYLTKPFELPELLARMRAITRRRHGASNSIVGSGNVQLDLTTREVLYKGTRETLTAREFALMHAMLERPGAILSREQLESRIYGWGEEVMSNAVDVIIHNMRRKLGADTIRNVRGLGWRIVDS
jgi:DNA-binding response OmpR family regulator